ncbi:MAG: hypothetical protein CMO80_00285 [Verrucomicrobiales bacterium]|nr:hypothetical protein [Verrucomicrobiales bacterium]|tara:strand:+ start:153 stop:638 length:486 start_codon:yes stop_codon:yes gene_type:complete
MNLPESDESLEILLDEMKPAKAPEQFRIHIEQSMPEIDLKPELHVTSAPWMLLLRRLALPVAASSALLWAWMSMHLQPAPIQKPDPGAKRNPLSLVYTPVETNSVLLGSEELTLVNGPDNRPVRLMREVWLDYSRSEAADGSELFLTDTREQIVPVALEFN